MPVPRTLRPAGPLGRRLAALLAERKITRYRLHLDTGLSASQVGRILAGRCNPSLDTLRKLAFSLGVSLDDLTSLYNSDARP